MAQTNIRLKVDPQILQKLTSSDAFLCSAAHSDGSDNRVNWNAVGDAYSIDTSVGVLTSVFQGLRKVFRNRSKTKEDLAAEKEAANINRSCGALSQMLLEYLQAAQAGSIDKESLDDLINVLSEMDGYAQAGKLKIPEGGVLPEICKSIAAFTDALTGDGNTPSDQGSDIQGAKSFRRIQTHLIRQRNWFEKGNA